MDFLGISRNISGTKRAIGDPLVSNDCIFEDFWIYFGFQYFPKTGQGHGESCCNGQCHWRKGVCVQLIF